MANLWLFCPLFLYTFLILSASSSRADSTVHEKSIQLPSKGPKGSKGDDGYPGPKGPDGSYGFEGRTGANGEIGDAGFGGAPGLIGRPGLKGEPGVSGFLGIPGRKGTIGEPGFVGPPGLNGAPGFTGEPGDPGQDGPNGQKGEEGDDGFMGRDGRIGRPGPPGPPGSCNCDVTKDEDVEFGVEEKPAKVVTCKAAPQPLTTDYYYIGPGPIKVKCVTRTDKTTLTCIPPIGAGKTITFNKKTWLSQHNLKIKDIYGITEAQISWIQKQSASAYQIIRYHCLNSNPFPRDNVDKSLQLLSWSDKTLGPIPTLTKPFSYNILPEKDGCSKVTNESDWSYTDIKLVSDSTRRRVPVIDFLVKDIRVGKTQSVKIEHIELCFD